MQLKESFERVDKWYVDINQEYKDLYPKMKLPEERKKFLDKYRKVINDMKHEIDCLNAEVVFLETEDKRDDVNNQIRVFEMYVMELEGTLSRELYHKDNFDYKIFDKVNERKELLAKVDLKDQKSNTVKDLKQASIDEGDRLYAEAQNKLKNIREKIRISSERLNAINEEIRAQNYKMLEIDEIIVQSQSLFVRAGDLIKFFTKVLLRDKCINVMVGLLFFLVLAVLALVIMQKMKGTSSATAATNSTTSTNTTSGQMAMPEAVPVYLIAESWNAVSDAVQKIHFERLPTPFANPFESD